MLGYGTPDLPNQLIQTLRDELVVEQVANPRDKPELPLTNGLSRHVEPVCDLLKGLHIPAISEEKTSVQDRGVGSIGPELIVQLLESTTPAIR
jgi:hypothetical protein